MKTKTKLAINLKGKTTAGAIEDFRPNVPTYVIKRKKEPKVSISVAFSYTYCKSSKVPTRGIIKVYESEVEATLARYTKEGKEPFVVPAKK